MRTHQFLLSLICGVTCTLEVTPAAAQSILDSSAQTTAYALVIGNNTAGAGQASLQYAEDDARKVSALLRELGNYREDRVHRLFRPRAGEVLAALQTIKHKLERHHAQGEQTTFIFYYSGKTTAHALKLGHEALMVETLISHFQQLSATLKVAIFDVCQNMSLSRITTARIKTVRNAQNFSYNAIAKMRVADIAVMVSTAAGELNQESDLLQAGYFSHHLLVALRGAGDENKNGQVSLDEAYRYVYMHTLRATSKTAVRHVTLKTELHGHGQVPLSYLAQAKSQLALTHKSRQRVLIQHAAEDAVIAEISRSEDTNLKLALPKGAYRLTLQQGDWVNECRLELKDGVMTHIDPSTCPKVPWAIAHPRGANTLPPLNSEQWAVEVTRSFSLDSEDHYSKRLEAFGYTSDSQLSWDDVIFMKELLIEYKLNPNLGLFAQYHHLDQGDYRRAMQASELDTELVTTMDPNGKKQRYFSWSAHAIAPGLRYSLRLFEPWLNGFLQGAVGVAYGTTRLSKDASYIWSALLPSSEWHFGLYAGGTLGLQAMVWQDIGFVCSLTYDFARFIDNAIGDTRDSGGFSVQAGVRIRAWK